MEKAKKFYIGLDVHKVSTTYCVRERLGSIIDEGECASRYKDLKTVLGPYLTSAKTALEASTSYYKLYQGFLADDFDIRVANTLQLRQLVAKNDTLDARRLSDMLRLGTMPESFIPGKKIQRLRSIVHARHALVEESTRWKNRIHALLDKAGISLSAHGGSFTKRWTAALGAYLASGEADEVLRYASEHYQGVAARLEELTKKMVAATREHWIGQHDLLQRELSPSSSSPARTRERRNSQSRPGEGCSPGHS
jgi:transposase